MNSDAEKESYDSYDSISMGDNYSFSNYEPSETRNNLARHRRRVPRIEMHCDFMKWQAGILQAQIQDLEQQKREVEVTIDPERRMPLLPVEVWTMIFVMASYFRGFLPRQIEDTSGRIQAEWKRTFAIRKAIVRVCRTWRTVGKQLLYQYITLNEMYQLAALAKALEDSASRQGQYTLGLNVKLVVPASWNNVFNSFIARVLRSCPNLTTFCDSSDRAELWVKSSANAVTSMIPQTLISLASFANLDLSPNNAITLDDLILLSPHLQCLQFGGVYQFSSEVDTNIIFPQLRRISLFRMIGDSNPAYGILINWTELILGHRLSAPQLRHACIEVTKEAAAGIRQVLDQFGERILSLRLHMPHDSHSLYNFNPEFHYSSLEKCPNLIHLCLPLYINGESEAVEGLPSISFPSLTTIGIRGLIPHSESFPYQLGTRRDHPPGLTPFFETLESERFLSLRRIWAADENVDGIVDPKPLPWKVHIAWKRWITHWKEQDVAFENYAGNPLRMFRVDFWEGVAALNEQEQIEETESEYDEGMQDPIHTTPDTPSESLISDDGSDRAYRYVELKDVAVSTADEEEVEVVDEDEEVDEETALEIFDSWYSSSWNH